MMREVYKISTMTDPATNSCKCIFSDDLISQDLCFELHLTVNYEILFLFSHSHGRPLTLKFTHTKGKMNLLPLTLIGYNMTCIKPDDLVLLYKQNTQSDCVRYKTS